MKRAIVVLENNQPFEGSQIDRLSHRLLGVSILEASLLRLQTAYDEVVLYHEMANALLSDVVVKTITSRPGIQEWLRACGPDDMIFWHEGLTFMLADLLPHHPEQVDATLFVGQSGACVMSAKADFFVKKGYPNTHSYEEWVSFGADQGLVVQQQHVENDLMAMHNLYDLSVIEGLLRQDIIKQWQMRGVRVIDPQQTSIDFEVVIGPDCILYPGTLLTGQTTIGAKCLIGPDARIDNSMIGSEVTIKDSTVISSSVDDRSTVGPYAYLRPKSDLGKGVKIGDFVEVKNARLDDGAKVSHLSYIGDGHVGKRANIGCGVVFVNYDGVNKNRTIVEDDAFVGCNANLVAPVTIKKGAYVAAGSTITEDVESHSLAIARSRQTQKLNWVSNKENKEK